MIEKIINTDDVELLDGRGQVFISTFKNLRSTIEIILNNRLASIGTAIMLIFLFSAIFAPFIAPHNPSERVINEDGSWNSQASPSVEHPFGTTTDAKPIFSRVVFGTRIAFLVGLVVALLVGVVGTLIGVTAGYYGGNFENILMRFVDVAYGLPFLPFVIALIIVIGQGSIWTIIFALTAISWRSTARVVRSEVVSIKEQPMIDAAIASGATHRRILFYHVTPKILPITLLYMVFAIGWAIIAEAGLSFLGLGDPDLISWGGMLNAAHINNAVQHGMWNWMIPPGLAIVLFVLATYFMAQGLEEVVNPEIREK